MLAPLFRRKAALPVAVFVVCAGVYVATLGKRMVGLSDNAHYVFLAQSLLHGKLSLLAGRPPGDNDWAFYHGSWYVSFPPFPALVIAPLVALFDLAVWDRLVWAVVAGLAPALLFVLLRRLREQGLTERSTSENLALTALFAFGSPFYYTSVQGTVWFAAHVVACSLIALYLLGAFGAARPLLAGSALACTFMTRGPTVVLLGLFFAHQLWQDAQRPNERPITGVRARLANVDWPRATRKLAWFSAPPLLALAIAMWMNAERFDDPFEFGHSHLRIRWSGRIETWGLFNYHYLGRNLGVFLASLPWLSAKPPFVKISRHGLALWVTTPQLLLVLWPKRTSPTMTALAWAAGLVALADLCYQNSGWVQFGYRFSLDYSLLLFALLALGGRRFGKGFYALMVWAIIVNTFGAITFDRVERFYDSDPTQRVIFQPD